MTITNTIINLTPHTVRLEKENGEFIEFIPSGIVARISTEYGKLSNFPSLNKNLEKNLKGSGINFIYTEFSDPINLPEESMDKIYIVSAILKNALPDRNDLVVPADLIRDEKGNVIGCRALSF